MNDWVKVKLGDLISIKGGFSYKGEFIGKGSSLLLGMGCVSFNGTFLHSGARLYSGDVPDVFTAYPDDIVLATRQQSDNLPILGAPAIIPQSLKNEKVIVGTNLYKVENKSHVKNNFLFWLLKNIDYRNHIDSCAKGSTVKMITKDAVESYEFICPPEDVRNLIAGTLWNINDKIDLLNRQNTTLEKMAETLFKQWFIEEAKEEWNTESLSGIATFLNGLACQKFPPKNEIDKLPVLKIKELSNGITDSSDWATTNIRSEYIVRNGDVIFAWSASLMVKIWNGQDCILNQHLFKVTSIEYPKWFYYMWCKYHLDEFLAIAASHATTMGHIKRGDLDDAKVLIPPPEELDNMTEQMKPLMDKIIANNRQITSLTKLRDTLLPKLMSGEIRVSE